MKKIVILKNKQIKARVYEKQTGFNIEKKVVVKMENKYHTMRSAFKRWLVLHNEEWRNTGYVRIPNWFRHYIRKNKDWSYTVINNKENYYCNRHEMDYNQRRKFKGYYLFEISDEELLNLQRTKWIK